MRVVSIAVVCASLAGCGSASAVVPDSNNPAHCIAALNMAVVWNDKSKAKKHPEWSPQFRAGVYYLMDKIRISGGSLEKAQAEGAAFTKANHSDPEMPEFVFECLKDLARDPNFKGTLPAEAFSQ